MASGLFWKILFSVISLSYASDWSGKICTKQILHKFNIYKWDAITRKVVSEEKIRKNIIFVCCEGYRERSRNKELPNCYPICKQSCGYGYCYRANLCACYHGYEVSQLDGTCKPIGSYDTSLNPWFKVRSSTRPSSTAVADFIHSKLTTNKTSSFETTIPTTSKHFKGLEFGRTREHENFSTTISTTTKKFKGLNKRKQIYFPKVKFITYGDSDLSTTSPASTRRNSFEVETTTNQVDQESSLSTAVTKITTHTDSIVDARNPSSTRNMSFEYDSSASQTSRKSAVLKSSETEFAKYQTTKAPHSKFPTDTISSLNEFKNLANCTKGFCTCQMGYQISEEKFCIPCHIGSQCQCRDGYAFDSVHCKPLCNGVFDGCIRGICIEYNECGCISGTEKSTDDIYRCNYVNETSTLGYLKKIDSKWYLLVLLVPVVIAGISFYMIIIKRSRTSKSNRLRAKRNNNFQEIRYFHTNNNYFEQKKYHGTDGQILKNDSGFDEQNGSILIIKV